jgi:Zn-dependent peptidase ImmA (M78 family)
MAHYSEEELEEMGSAVRRLLDLDELARLDVIEFLRRLKHRGYISDYVRVPDITLSDAEAKYVADGRKILIRKSVYDAAVNEDEHCRFTLVHEGSHALLNHQFERKRSLHGGNRAEMAIGSIRRDERQADKLAAILLAPFAKADFTLSTTIEDLMRRFGLSARTATLRHEEMSKRYRNLHGIPRPLPKGVIDFLAARRREGIEVKSLSSPDLVALQVRQVTYTGDICPACDGFKMIRIGTRMQCDECGAITGDS